MAWTTLAGNQFVSFTDAQGSPFIKLQTVPTSNQFMTKQNCLDYMKVKESKLSAYASNQWVKNIDIESYYASIKIIPYWSLKPAGVPGQTALWPSAFLAKRALVDFTTRIVTGYSAPTIWSTGVYPPLVGDTMYNPPGPGLLPADLCDDGYYLVDKGGGTWYFTASQFTDPIIHLINGVVYEILYLNQSDIDYNAKAWRGAGPSCLQA